MTLDTHRGNMQSEAGPTRVNSVVDVMLAHQLQYYAFITSLVSHEPLAAGDNAR